MRTPYKFIRTQLKGLVTIPIMFRQELNIQHNDLLEARLLDNGILLTKVVLSSPRTSLYSDKKIKEWMRRDKMDVKTTKKIQKLLRSR